MTRTGLWGSLHPHNCDSVSIEPLVPFVLSQGYILYLLWSIRASSFCVSDIIVIIICHLLCDK